MRKIALVIVAFLTLSCTKVVKLPPKHGGSEFTQAFYVPEYASGFRIMSLPDDTTQLMLEVFAPDTARVVIPEGGFRRVVTMSSTYIAHLEAAGALDRLVGASSPNYISSPAVRAISLPDVGHDGAMNYEQLIAVKPELVMLYGVGGPSPIVPKLEELQIPYVYISDFEEQSPLGRAEWVVASGALVGKDLRSFFKSVERAYSPAEGSVPVMINAPYGGTWFIPGKEGFMSRLIADAGGRIIAPQEGGHESRPIDSEEALLALSNSRLWLCPGSATNQAELRLAVPKARFSGDVWNQTSDFYESGAVRPDSVLSELKQIMSETVSVDSLRYFYRVK